MNQAISVAIDVPVEQLIIHRIGNNGKNKAYGNVQDKQTGKRYYVNIDWVDNEGWKPVLVQTLKKEKLLRSSLVSVISLI